VIMATFHSLNPPMGTHLRRQAPDMLSVELELLLPQGYFLPAEDIQAEVWTNVLHKLNPDGPAVWSAIPMKLSHVIPGTSIAVFAARFQPTGRGDFGLTARWKSHKDVTNWQWVPAAEAEDTANSNNSTLEGNKDVSITVRVPRNISKTSSWTMGPQSVMVFGQDGPRVEGYNAGGASVGGPGLYLGNHAAATRARISGYDSVLSLVGDILDFDEKIPETDKELNKIAWIEQATANTQRKRYSSLSRSSSITPLGTLPSLDSHMPEEYGYQPYPLKDTSRRSSVHEFMLNHEPGSTSDDLLPLVVDIPEEPERLTHRNSVTDMMVKLPSSIKQSNRSLTSVDPPNPLDNIRQNQEQEAAPADAALTVAAPNIGTKQADASENVANAPASQEKYTQQSASRSRKAKKSSGKNQEQPGSNTLSLEHPSPTIESLEITTAPDANALPPIASARIGVNGNSMAGTAETSDSTHPHTLSPTATQGGNTSTTPASIDTAPSSLNDSNPPSSAKVISGLSKQFWESQPSRPSSGSNGSFANGQERQAKWPFQHKVLTMSPGAHNVISDAVLKEAVEFLRKEIAQGKKVLVHCRDGNGRSGSVVVAYIASQMQIYAKRAGHKDSEIESYYDASLKEVWKWKCDVYPHKGLKQSIERIQW
ncbi:hypothetical protein BX616_010237, partial [Lobosporangium transversale]